MPGARHTEIGGLIVDEVEAGVGRLKRVIYPPGWRWTDSMAEVTGTETCQRVHVGFIAQGTMVVRFDDGCEVTFSAPGAVVIEPVAVVDAQLRTAEGRGGHESVTAHVEDARFGDLLGDLAAAGVALVEGRPRDAISLAGRLVDRESAEGSLNQVRVFDLVARAQLDAGDLEAAAETAGRGLTFAEPMDFGTVIWRLRMVRAIATGESTDPAAAEFRHLADRIPDPELRGWFERQPLAPR